MWDQLLVGADPGDAITNNAVLLHNRFNDFGPARIYSQHLKEGVSEPVGTLDQLRRRPNRERPLIFHASMGSWPVYQALADEPTLILIYHNFAPAEPFVDLAPHVASDLVRGRWELAQIRDRVILAIADSEFNAQELRDLGYEDVQVVPPTPDVHRLDSVAPDPETLRYLDERSGGPHVLCVAQQMPHKRIERVLGAMAVLQQEYLPDARLTVIGMERFHRYSDSLHVLSNTLGLRDVWFAGRVTDAQLAACYLRARAFLTLSDREGFCIPVVEAMALGVPVIDPADFAKLLAGEIA